MAIHRGYVVYKRDTLIIGGSGAKNKQLRQEDNSHLNIFVDEELTHELSSIV